MQTIFQMCLRSLDLKEKKHAKKHLKEEQAQEDHESESNSQAAGVIFDGDQDANDISFGQNDSDDEWDNWSQNDEASDDDSDDELEDSTLYNVCEVLFFKEKLGSL